MADLVKKSFVKERLKFDHIMWLITLITLIVLSYTSKSYKSLEFVNYSHETNFIDGRILFSLRVADFDLFAQMSNSNEKKNFSKQTTIN